MKIIKINYDQKTGEVLNIKKIPEHVLSKITSFYLLLRRKKTLSPEQRSEIAKKAAKRSAEVRSLKAKLGTLKKYERKVKA